MRVGARLDKVKAFDSWRQTERIAIAISFEEVIVVVYLVFVK
jgi:hypothetical protein